MKVTPAKVIGIILIVLVVAAAGGVIWMYASSELTVRFVSCVATDPLTVQGDFDTIRAQMESDTFVGTRFSDEALGSADGYVFYTWTVEIRNDTFLQADVIEIQVLPRDGDIAQLGDRQLSVQQVSLADGGNAAASSSQLLFALDPHESGTLSVTVLAKRDTFNARNGKVTWYFWGLPFHADVKLYAE